MRLLELSASLSIPSEADVCSKIGFRVQIKEQARCTRYLLEKASNSERYSTRRAQRQRDIEDLLYTVPLDLERGAIDECY